LIDKRFRSEPENKKPGFTIRLIRENSFISTPSTSRFLKAKIRPSLGYLLVAIGDYSWDLYAGIFPYKTQYSDELFRVR
jgi:hypothetical protein